MRATSRVQMLHLLYSRIKEFAHLLLENWEFSMKQIEVLGQHILKIIGLKSCCLGKAAQSLACLAVWFCCFDFVTLHLTIKHAN